MSQEEFKFDQGDINDDNNPNNDIEDEDEIVFAGQVSRATTQVTGLTNMERAKTLMSLTTSQVPTKINNDSKQSPYDLDANLFKFSNPDRPDDDLDTAMNQMYNGQVIDDKSDKNKNFNRQATFNDPTLARKHDDNGNNYPKGYPKSLLFKSDGSQDIIFFGKLESKASCCSLMLSTAIALMFCGVAILFFPVFGNNQCDAECAFTTVPDDLINGVINSKLTLLGGCSQNHLLVSYKNDGGTISFSNIDSFEDLQGMEDNVDSLYVTGSDLVVYSASGCSNIIQSSGDDIRYIEGYMLLDYDTYTWEWSTTGFFLVLSLLMAFFFMLIEWLFYSYNQIMIPYKDWRAYIMWYLIRMGWMSYMFVIIIAHSFTVTGDMNFMVGTFGYLWLEADCYIATAYIGIFLLICLCCCCFQESDGITGNIFASNEDIGCERYFLPQSRIDRLVINDFEQGLGSAMCASMIFVISFIICGIVPFLNFFSGGLGGYANTPYIASIWFLTIVAMNFQMCWFVRARCCSDEEDREKAAMHDNAVQQRHGAPDVISRAATAP